jgi:hypothetical protein
MSTIAAPNKDLEAQRLADAHYQLEENITAIYRLNGVAETLPNEPIKLLEVNTNTVPSGIVPLRFDPAPSIGISFPSTIVEVTPGEFQQIGRGELKLPDGWTLGGLLPPSNRG